MPDGRGGEKYWVLAAYTACRESLRGKMLAVNIIFFPQHFYEINLVVKFSGPVKIWRGPTAE